MDHVRRHILEAPGVVDCHDLHAWTITSGMNVVSAHVVVAEAPVTTNLFVVVFGPVVAAEKVTAEVLALPECVRPESVSVWALVPVPTWLVPLAGLTMILEMLGGNT